MIDTANLREANENGEVEDKPMSAVEWTDLMGKYYEHKL
jgi:hypothetical protein